MRRPLVPLAACFIAGTVLAYYWPASVWPAAALCAATFAATAALAARGNRAAFFLLMAFAACVGLLNLRAREEMRPADHVRDLPLEQSVLVSVKGTVCRAPSYGEKLTFAAEPYSFRGPGRPVPGGEDGEDAAKARRLSFDVDEITLESEGRVIPVSGPVRVFLHLAAEDTAREARAFAEEALPGGRVDLLGTLSRPYGAGNPGQFDYAEYLRGRGIFAVLSVERLKWARAGGPQGFSPAWHVSGVKEAIARSFYQNLSRENAAFLSALLLGERQSLPDDLLDDLSASGTAHFLSISGLHLAIIASFGYFALRLLMVPYNMQRVLLIAGIIFYASLIGPRPPVIRAAIMITLFLFAQLIGRRSDTLNVLALAALAIAAVNPMDVMTAGYQLSFLAVLCILLFTGPAASFLRALPQRARYMLSPGGKAISFAGYRRVFETHLAMSPWPRRAAAAVWNATALALATSVAAWLGTFPIIMFHFGTFSVWTAAANLVMAPMIYIWLLAGFLLLVASLVQSAFGGAALLLPRALGHIDAVAAIEWPAYVFARMPLSFRNIPCVPFYSVILFYGGVFSLLLWRRFRWGRYLCVGFAAAAAAAVLISPAELAGGGRGGFELTVLDVGHGGATFIRFPDGRTLLYDCGSYREQDVARRVLQPFFRERGVTRLDAVVISHPHVDHFDGLPALLQNYDVGVLVLTDYFTPDVNEYWTPVWSEIERSGVNVVRMRDGGALEGFPELSFYLADVRLPARYDPEYNRALNDASLVMRVECGAVSALLTGDIESRGIAWFNARYDGPPVDVMTAPHHGDCEPALTEALLDRVRPRVMVIPTDRRAPRPQLRSAAEGRGIALHLSRTGGAITLRLSGAQPRIIETLAH